MSRVPSTSSPQARQARDTLQRTPHLLLGPFYPIDNEALAASRAARPTVTKAPSLQIGGRVLNLAGAPVAHALIEIWQADDAGHYRHPAAPIPPCDPAFAGYDRTRTDADGNYGFRTIKPGPYGEGANRRAPHVHFQVTGVYERLVTQMFFAGEVLNDSDHWYCSATRRESLVASTVTSDLDRIAVRWDIVLSLG